MFSDVTPREINANLQTTEEKSPEKFNPLKDRRHLLFDEKHTDKISDGKKSSENLLGRVPIGIQNSDEEIYKCNVCNIETTSSEAYNSHMRGRRHAKV